jgi:hypothetical protein
MISEVISGVVLDCGGYCLNSCSVEASVFRLSLILICLFSGYKASLFFLKVKEGRSRKSNMDSTLPVKD